VGAAGATRLRANHSLVEVGSVISVTTAFHKGLLLLSLARRAEDSVSRHTLALVDELGLALRALAHGGRRLPLLHVVDAALSDALLVELGLAAVAADVGEAAETLLSEAHARCATHCLLVSNGIGDTQ